MDPGGLIISSDRVVRHSHHRIKMYPLKQSVNGVKVTDIASLFLCELSPSLQRRVGVLPPSGSVHH